MEAISGTNVGGAALLASVLVGASFLTGTLMNRILTDLSIWWVKRRENKQQGDSKQDDSTQFRSKVDNVRKKNPETIRYLETLWVAKSLYRSVAVAGIPIISLLFYWNSIIGGRKAFWAIYVIGSIGEIAVVNSFFSQREEYESECNRLGTSSPKGRFKPLA